MNHPVHRSPFPSVVKREAALYIAIKKAFACVVLFVLAGTVSWSAEESREEKLWSTDYTATLRRAKATGRPALVYFSGSSWCGFCKRLNSEVLSKDEFKAFAKEKLELVNLDFPKGSAANDEAHEFNAWLKQQLGVGGFPALLVMDGDGVILGKVGYAPGGPKALIASITKILNRTN